jgi:hypothetical protein
MILKAQHYNQNKRENMNFGSSYDFHFLSNTCKELSIIYFCQILNNGNKEA